MVRAWIELHREQAGWGPARVIVARLGRDGYVAQVLVGFPAYGLLYFGALRRWSDGGRAARSSWALETAQKITARPLGTC